MAHGFLAYEPVSGESPLVNFAKKKLKEGLKALWGKFQKTSGSLVKSSGGQVQYDANPQGVTVKDVTQPEPAAKKMFSGTTARALGAGIGSISKQEPSAIPGGTSGGIATRPGGSFTELPGISAASGGLNAETFFKQATTGVGSSGEYLSNAQRREAFIKSRQEGVKTAEASASAPPISPDSGVDIVAAVNRNTQMIVSLVEAVKAQTKNDSNLVEKQIQGQETLMLRAAARDEEASLEQGSDLSGFMTPENFAKRKKNEEKKETGSKLKEFFRGPNPFKKDEGCGCSPIMPGPGGRGPILGGPPGGGGLPIPDYVDQYRDMNRRPGSRLGGGAPVTRRAGGGRRATRLATKIGGKGAGKAVAKGLGKFGAKRIPGLGLLAGIAFGAERAMKGDFLGAAGEVASGALGPAGFAIDAGLAARDAGLTPFAEGGIVTSPVAGLVGEAGNEGIFPLEGKRGEKTFRMFGEGVFQAQKDNDKDFAKLQSMGLKQYYEREGGFKKMGEGLKGFFESLAGGIASLFGGAANAGTLDQAGDYLGGGDFSGNSAQDQAMNYFISQGLSKDQAAGIVGNLMQESTAALDPKANNGTHRGIAQWDKNRWANFEKFAKKKGLDVNTREAQLQWIMEEMRTGDGGLGIERFKKTKTAAEAAALFVKDYERSGEKPGQAGYDARIRNANTLATRQITGGGGPGRGGGSSSALANAAARLKGMSTKDSPDGGENGCVWAVNKVYKAAGITPPWGSSVYVPDAEKKMIGSGYQQVGYGQRQPGDVMVMYDRQSPPQAHIGVVLPNGNILSNSSSKAKFAWEASPEEYNRYYGAQGKIYRMPGGASASTIARNRGNQSTAAAPAQPLSTNGNPNGNPNAMSPLFQRPAANKPAAAGVTPSPLFNMSAANANTGTPMMATSQQVAMASMSGGAAPTVINNYYTSAGGSGGGVNPNGVSPGIGMEQTGTAVFQDLRIRALA
jgi:hypothetical protein